MSVDILDRDAKRIKLEDTAQAPLGSRATLRKDKPKNSHLPPGTHDGGKWRSVFLPSLIYWLGNSKYPWTVPEDMLSSVLEDIFAVVYGKIAQFDIDSLGFAVVCIPLNSTEKQLIYVLPGNSKNP
jgi:hypothetical protein